MRGTLMVGLTGVPRARSLSGGGGKGSGLLLLTGLRGVRGVDVDGCEVCCVIGGSQSVACGHGSLSENK